jgi:hypothetical protein
MLGTDGSENISVGKISDGKIMRTELNRDEYIIGIKAHKHDHHGAIKDLQFIIGRQKL